MIRIPSHRRHTLAVFVTTLVAAPLVFATAGSTSASPSSSESPSVLAAKIERGRYLTTIAGCHDCHTPFHVGPNGPEPDMSRMLSGHPHALEMPPPPTLPEGPWIMTVAATNTAWAGPWGVSFTANLTPDVETGLGSWTEEEFIGAIKTGRHRGRGRQILPPMPWPFLGQATEEDLSAIWAFLRSIPPISNRVPDPIPPVSASAAGT